MILYVRVKPKSRWINFVHNIQELRELLDSYIPGRPLLLGDLSTFNRSMKNMLLKFVEDNSTIDLYSSADVTDRVLLSRFPVLNKEPLQISATQDTEQFKFSDRKYVASASFLSGLSKEAQLRAPLVPQNMFSFLELL